MANVRINSLPSNKYQVVESITEAKKLEMKDSGKYFMYDQGDYTINLPKLSTELAGWNCLLIRRSAGSADMKLKAHEDDGAKLYYIEVGVAITTSTNTAITTITATGTGTSSTAPVQMKAFTDGSYWYLYLAAHADNYFSAA